MTGSSASLTAVPVCCQSGPHSLVQSVAININVLLAIFKEGAGNILL